jgi:hypothetical protein
MKEQKIQPPKMKLRYDRSLDNVDLSKLAPEKQAKANEALKHIKLPDFPSTSAAK